MSVPAFLAELRSRDIQVWAEGDRLRCNAPAGTPTPELRNELQQRKNNILEFLRTAEVVARQQPAIVPMESRGTHIPVFAVPGHNGDIFAYRDVVRHLGDDQPFFGLHPPGLDGQSALLERVEDHAAYFAEQIIAFRPNGPYIIAGYCAGGAVALELARQLSQRGAMISFLALFGCPYPTEYRFLSSLPYWGTRLLLHTRALGSQSSLKDAWQYLTARLRRRTAAARAERTPAGTDPLSLVKFKFEQAMMAAVRRYTPRRFSGRVCLIQPNRDWQRPAKANRDSPSRDWFCWRSVAPLTEEYFGPDDCEAPRMLIEPNVPPMAELFRVCREKYAAGVAQ